MTQVTFVFAFKEKKGGEGRARKKIIPKKKDHVMFMHT